MASDRDLVSTEEHELNYVLKKWEKRQTKENREKLTAALKAFNKDAGYKHTQHLRTRGRRRKH